MKFVFRFGIVLVFSAVVVGVVSLGHAYADTTPAMMVPSADDLKRVSANCYTIKSSLNQLHVNDALLRVNRGQIYESLSSKLMQRFNTRLTNNGLDAKNLIATTQNYDNLLTSFRSDYQGYEELLSAAISIDCTKQPANFYITVQNARAKRNQVHSDVVGLNNAIDTYSDNVNQFQTTFDQNQGAGH